jgi:tetratricopeptide (TPR) repeat protein
VFYLAQTYECLGDLTAAQALYARRARMVGYRDETYEAAFRRGRVLDRQGASEADAAYLEAYVLDPRRAEPLCALALRHLRAGRLAVAYLFARRAAELPAPSTDLFIDEGVYAWGAADLVAASAFHLRGSDPGAFEVGLACAERAHRACPDDPRIAQNLACYRQAQAALAQDARALDGHPAPARE